MTEENKPSPEPSMEVGVRFRHNSKVYSFAASGVRLSIGDKVLVRTEKGVDIGEVMEIHGRIPPERADELMPVVRKATDDDLAHVAEQETREKQALEICGEAIDKHELPMKLIDADLSFDNTRLVFFFSADGRVDFRELVRDLARTFRMRIELRQIGVRDEARLLGGLGPCGRRLCCKTFMREFEPVGIRVAKDQGLALNPSKISGLCDRLMCCLLFEHEMYCELRRTLPRRGDRVRTEHGPGTVKDVALLKEELHVVLDDGSDIRVLASEVGPLGGDDDESAEEREPRPEQPARAQSRPAAQPGPDRPEQQKPQEGPEARREQPDGGGKQSGSGGRRKSRGRRLPGSDGAQARQAGKSDTQKRDGGGRRDTKQDAKSARDAGQSQEGGSKKPRSSRRRRGRRRPRSDKGTGQAGPQASDGGNA